jgi:hypothetical protein
MTMDTESAVARRLVQLFQHLGLTQVHLAARVTADWHGLISTQPEMIASLTLVCPTGLEASPLRSLATRLFMLTGDQGAPAEAVHKAMADLPEATLATLHPPLSPMAGRGRLGQPRRWSTWGNRVGRPVGKSAGH